MKSDLICYIDCDGVLSNFDRKASSIIGGNFQKSDKDESWEKLKDWNDDHVKGFFASLPVLPDAKKLITFIKDHFKKFLILTANDHSMKTEGPQKRQWIKDHIDKTIQVKMVTHGKQKAVYANPSSILIDNEKDNITAWEKAGGIGIHHTSTKETIKQLKKIIS